MSSLTDPDVRLTLLLIAFACLGLWIAAFKMQRGSWRFELFAVDFAIGAFLLSLGAALLIGNFGTDLPFNDRLMVSSKTSQALMAGAGLIFGVANTFLLGAVSLLGVPAAFAIGGGVALTVGAGLKYTSVGPTAFLPAASCFLAAALLAVFATRTTRPKPVQPAKNQPLGPIRLSRSAKGILVALVGGAGIGVFYPLAMRGAFDDFGLGPYAGIFIFCTGMLVANVVFSLYFFNIALEGGALSVRTYLRNWPRKHLPGILGGAIWATGALAVLLVRTGTLGDPGSTTTAASYFPLGSIPLAICLGIVAWREPKGPKALLLLVFAAVAIIAGIFVLASGHPLNKFL